MQRAAYDVLVCSATISLLLVPVLNEVECNRFFAQGMTAKKESNSLEIDKESRTSVDKILIDPPPLPD